MLKRVLSAVALLALVAVCFIVSTETAMLLVMVFGVISCHEMKNALKKLNRNIVEVIPMAFIVASSLAIYFKLDMIYLIAFAALLIMSAFVVCMRDEKRTAQDALATLATLVYPAIPFIGVIYVCSLPSYSWVVIFLTGFLSAVLCDTFALFGGMAFGKHKLAPVISPNKTVEGSISGTVVTTLISIGVWFLLKDYINYSLLTFVITVAVCTVVAQIGDLSASFIKREAGIKDFGNFIPGHGGALDRIDSMMFSIPTAYILLTMLK